MSHVHQMPQTGRAQIGPVTSIDRAENNADFGSDQRDDIGSRIALDQIQDRSSEIDEEEDERGPGRRYVVVENPLHVAHGPSQWEQPPTPGKAHRSAELQSGLRG